MQENNATLHCFIKKEKKKSHPVLCKAYVRSMNGVFHLWGISNWMVMIMVVMMCVHSSVTSTSRIIWLDRCRYENHHSTISGYERPQLFYVCICQMNVNVMAVTYQTNEEYMFFVE